MSKAPALLLHRDDPDKPPLVGHVKVTREDWLNVARDILISEGVGQVKVLGIAERLDVSRSSFYWYFKSRKDLLSQLLEDWNATNTGIMIRHTELPAKTITGCAQQLLSLCCGPRRLQSATRLCCAGMGAARRLCAACH